MSAQLLNNTIKFAQQSLKNAEGGHDWWHTYRVWNNTKRILQTENADTMICELAALLHDIADHKFHNKEKNYGAKIAEEFLQNQKLATGKIQRITFIIENISFSSEIDSKTEKNIELQIVQDADRLDALGAIGIARTFNYGGYKNRAIYDPDQKPKKYVTSEEYTESQSPTINHFYEKLLLLKDKMNTTAGRKMAEERHGFMEEFLERFFREWGGGGRVVTS